MNNISIFFRTKILDTGFLADLGNFFLTPSRWLFSGKTIIVADDDTGIVAVPSFIFEEINESSRYNNTLSTNMDIGYAAIFVAIFFLASFIPGIILGSFFKGLSYINNPKSQKSHQKVKNRLTPIHLSIDFKKDQPTDVTDIQQCLSDHVASGQKIETLILSGNASLDYVSVQKIHHLNPTTLILNGIRAEKSQFDKEDWDSRALDHAGDYTSLGNSSYPNSALSKKKPGIISSVDEGLKNFSFMNFEDLPCRAHMVYVVTDHKHERKYQPT